MKRRRIHEPVDQSVEGRHEAWVLEPGGDAVAHERDHLPGREPVEQSVESRHKIGRRKLRSKKVTAVHGGLSKACHLNGRTLCHEGLSTSAPDQDSDATGDHGEEHEDLSIPAALTTGGRPLEEMFRKSHCTPVVSRSRSPRI